MTPQSPQRAGPSDVQRWRSEAAQDSVMGLFVQHIQDQRGPWVLYDDVAPLRARAVAAEGLADAMKEIALSTSDASSSRLRRVASAALAQYRTPTPGGAEGGKL